MLYEFALDPEVLNRWEPFRYLIDQFGIQHGRMIARFPKHWKRLVYEACKDCTTMELERITERLKDIDSKIFQSGRSYAGENPWILNAQTQHSTKPFRAIITKENPNNHPHVLRPDDLGERNALWQVPRGDSIVRSAEDLANCVEKLLFISTEILFIDPHFNPDKFQFRRPLELFIKKALCGTPVTRIEYHLKTNDSKMSSDLFKQSCESKLCGIIPAGKMVRFYRWQEREASEVFHARYILTNCGGVSFDYGLDEGEEGQTTDVSLLDTTLYQKRWDNFQRGTAPYELADEIEVIGSEA
jgi:hypothetical protein